MSASAMLIASNTQTASSWVVSGPSYPVIQRGLLILTVVCAALALVPPLRLMGSIALRAVTLLSKAAECADKCSNDLQSLVLRTIKITGVTLGIVALALASPVFMIASLATDVALQAIEAVKALSYSQSSKALLHIIVLAIDALLLAAVITLSWEVMLAAIAVSIVALAVITIVSCRDQDYLEAICFGALAILGVATVLTTSQVNVKISPNEPLK